MSPSMSLSWKPFLCVAALFLTWVTTPSPCAADEKEQTQPTAASKPVSTSPPQSPPQPQIQLPAPAREFRAAWVATIGNSCWPSKPGLTTDQQKAELIAILDRCAALKLNAVIFQVRPACDALYQSSLEPWSEYITGIQGRAPSPFYDPLAFAVAEAHRRGLELHAWINPFRAHHFQAVSPVAPNHISKTHPELVRTYGRYLWLDPGEPDVRAWSLRVILDIVKRYDIDGIHYDDYFYPYHEKNFAGLDLDFPDSASWKKYGAATGLARDDWRRHNVDEFVQQLYHGVKAEKPWVKVGISPFGIWRPKNPPTITGFDSYAELYADSRKWLLEGWCDYMSPQLYWPIQPAAQSFPVLLGWWNEQNSRHRHVWPGLDALKVGSKWQPNEIANQIALSRHFANPGDVLWSVMAIMRNGPLDAALAHEVYRETALIPACPWLDATSPPPPKLSFAVGAKSAHAQWQSGVGESAAWWVWQTRATNGLWTTQILPAGHTDAYLENPLPDVASIRAVNRVGTLSAPTIWTPKKYESPVINHGATKLEH